MEYESEYDHGDSWIQDITILGKELQNVRNDMAIPPQLKVNFGGESDWEDCKCVFKGKKADSSKDWYKTSCTNKDSKGLDPYK
ncbi:uncharacterized protein Bfra_004025 [Botrytis fragariae]|uniref:Uncharacterized protein n=1 Tax=Botrytis fragariae TaxID=1964551 RepID=A0A8H6AXY5_9HELO|nr:uncharacterized protein Bfra_004025 [Botrytis fragariae]KAF5875572.1 hypothetical protein Bfra_004025 [Botrytis fragariae]